ncbi:OsmC family protein [Cellulomonas sp. CW35]|uniref:OsmC family protein n=1 Tax=Cellulomonas sp. CW35 TaxID=3458249 RepID=UPI004034F44A
MAETYGVVVGAGSLRSSSDGAWRLPHRWTDEGVAVEAAFTGAHLLHVAAAGCVLNDVYREAASLGVALQGVRVTAGGGFDGEWVSTGITYAVEVDTQASPDEVARLVAVVDEVAEIPRAIRAGAPVQRVSTAG